MAIELNGSVRRRNLAVFAYLMGAAVLATVAMSPALLFLLDPDRPTPFSEGSVAPVQFVIGFAAANILLSAVAIAIGLRLEPTVRMGVPLLRSWLAADGTALRPTSAILVHCSALAFGLAAMVLAAGFAFRSQLPKIPETFVFPPIWQGILMMLGAAVREEILFRFFALNLFTWIAMKVLRKQEPTTAIVCVTNVLVAFVFASLHLLPAAQLLDLKPIAMGVIIALAAAAGVLFGWVYWRHGLLMAMFTHAIAGVLVYLAVRGLIAFAA
jgi:membrane protease YdiL (CAAX protease family)